MKKALLCIFCLCFLISGTFAQFSINKIDAGGNLGANMNSREGWAFTFGVHGDYDKPATALDKLTLMTHKHYDMLCTAHLHHFNMDEKNQTLIVSNGSLMGVDSYAEKLRLTSDPSQTFITVSKKNVAEAIYRIILK